MGDFIIALEIMLKGMAGIFVVIGILTLLVMLMGKISGPKKKEDEQALEEVTERFGILMKFLKS